MYLHVCVISMYLCACLVNVCKDAYMSQCKCVHAFMSMCACLCVCKGAVTIDFVSIFQEESKDSKYFGEMSTRHQEQVLPSLCGETSPYMGVRGYSSELIVSSQEGLG